MITHVPIVDESSARAAVSDFEDGMRHRGSEILTLAMKTVRVILATDTIPADDRALRE